MQLVLQRHLIVFDEFVPRVIRWMEIWRSFRFFGIKKEEEE